MLFVGSAYAASLDHEGLIGSGLQGIQVGFLGRLGQRNCSFSRVGSETEILRSSIEAYGVHPHTLETPRE